MLKGGIKIYTTFDRASAGPGRRRHHEPQAASGRLGLVAGVDRSGTGAVKAMVSGQDYARQPDQHRHLPGRPPDRLHVQGDHAGAALANGYSPDDTVDGIQPVLGARLRGLHRQRRAGRRHLTLWDATAGSVNCAFVRLATSVGEDKVIDMAHKMGDQQARTSSRSSRSRWASSSRTPRPWPTSWPRSPAAACTTRRTSCRRSWSPTARCSRHEQPR